jgi:alpha-D-xyloside xylohydrolase
VGFAVAAPDGRMAARGRVRRDGDCYTATVDEGALRDWRLQLGEQRSPVLAQGAQQSWTP